MADLRQAFPGGFDASKFLAPGTDLADPVRSFEEHCRANGLEIPDGGIIADGEIHRVAHTSSKRGERDAWYVLHLDGKVPAGVCGCWKGVEFEAKWVANTGRQLTFSERIEHEKWVRDLVEKKRQAKEAAQEKAAERAENEINNLMEASAEHPYLVRKRVKPHGIKINASGKLVIPIINSDGEIVSYQSIDADGSKRYLKDGKKDGGFFEIRGQRQVVFIGEGFATCASVHEATGYTVLVAFDKGNLIKVAKVAKELFVGSKIVLAGDNDQFTDGNPGLTCANAAAQAIGGMMVYPTFSDSEILAGRPKDFNDLHTLRGLDGLREQIDMVVAPMVREKTGFQFSKIGKLELKPIEWVVEDYIEADTLAQVFGDPGCGKSFVAIDVACCVATGTPWHGHEVRRGSVFYIAGEGHNGLNRRFKAWELGNGIDISEAPIYKSHRAAQFYDATEAALVAQSIKDMIEDAGCLPSLIVIDTLARNMGGDENSTKDMNAFIQHLDVYLKEPYKCCVMIIHHSGTGDKDRGRGSSAMKGAIDAEYKVALDKTSKTIQLTPVKMKDAEEPGPMNFSLTQIDLPINDKHGNPVKGAHLTTVDISGLVKEAQKNTYLSTNQRKALDCLINLEVMRAKDGVLDAITYDEWRESAKEHGIAANRLREVVQPLLKKGMVFEESDGYRTSRNLPKPTETGEFR